MGLLLARTLCRHRGRLSQHWAVTQVGVVPRGTFGEVMARNRFNDIMANLHFSNNRDVRATTDRSWKIRRVVDCIQRTFRRGFTEPPAVLSFDEGILPNRSPWNPVRQYLKDKPHKWGTKMYLTCCAKTAYCLRYVTRCSDPISFFYTSPKCCI